MATIMLPLSCPALAQTTGHTFSDRWSERWSERRPLLHTWLTTLDTRQACEQGGRAAGRGRRHVNP